MPFLASEKVEIRFFTGWSARFHQTDSALEQAMSAVESDADTLAFIQTTILPAIRDIRTKLTDAHGRLKALKVGSIELPEYAEVMTLRSEGRRHVGSLCSTMGVSARQDIFGAALPQDDSNYGSNYARHG